MVGEAGCPCRLSQGYVASLIAEARRTDAASVVVSMVSQGTATFQRAVAVVQNSVIGTGGRRIGDRGKPSLSTTAIMRCSI